MTDDLTRRRLALGLAAGALLPTAALAQQEQTYSEDEILAAAQHFFGAGAEGLATVVAHVFEDNGRPNGYIEGNEGSGAIGIGLRYGSGYLHMKNRDNTRVYWQGPSVGFDIGGNGSRTLVLVYDIDATPEIFDHFVGVEGSAYMIGGLGINFQTNQKLKLAPIRTGVGARLGANVGYLKYTDQPTWNPF